MKRDALGMEFEGAFIVYPLCVFCNCAIFNRFWQEYGVNSTENGNGLNNVIVSVLYRSYSQVRYTQEAQGGIM